MALPAERYQRAQPVGKAARHRSFDRPGGDGVDRDAVGGKLAREVVGQGMDPGLRGAVGGVPRALLLAGRDRDFLALTREGEIAGRDRHFHPNLG